MFDLFRGIKGKEKKYFTNAPTTMLRAVTSLGKQSTGFSGDQKKTLPGEEREVENAGMVCVGETLQLLIECQTMLY